ncbi:MAG TPA: PTS sugar transporter subunit IIC [Anaerolineaceae bacterium]|nr:PTS sugar transporter subunit IIC [Anaerolineaceae bacterium]
MFLAIFTGLMIIFTALSMGGIYNPLIFGVVTGLVVGDVKLGLEVGATAALLDIGFYTYGGATTPDYNIGAMFGTVVYKQSGSLEQGLLVATVVGLLISWFDIFGRGVTTVFQHGGDRALANKDIKAFERWHLLGTMGWFWSRFIPVFIGMLFIDKYQVIADFIANYAWIKNGLVVIGKALPAVGFALLLSYMDIKHFWPFMLVGYALFAYMNVPTIGLAIIGIALGYLFTVFMKKQEA